MRPRPMRSQLLCRRLSSAGGGAGGGASKLLSSRQDAATISQVSSRSRWGEGLCLRGDCPEDGVRGRLLTVPD